jgi:hypothetical protein
MSAAVNPEHGRNDVSVRPSRPGDDRAMVTASRPQTPLVCGFAALSRQQARRSRSESSSVSRISHAPHAITVSEWREPGTWRGVRRPGCRSRVRLSRWAVCSTRLDAPPAHGRGTGARASTRRNVRRGRPIQPRRRKARRRPRAPCT